MSPGKPIKIAIIGGGCAAMATAFELSHRRHGGKFEITIYQAGFRLGGKGASGRGDNDRIEEHGLHLWMGFYENAFRLMRDCYSELGRGPQPYPITDWTEAFEPAPCVGLTEQSRDGSWSPWLAHFPPGHGVPGDPLDEENPFSVRGYLERAAELVIELLGAARDRRSPGARGDHPGSRSRSGWPSMDTPSSIGGAIDRVLRYGELATTAALLEAAEVLRTALHILSPHLGSANGHQARVLRLIDTLAVAAAHQIGALITDDVELRRVWEIVDIILAVIRGCVRFNLALDPRGFDAIDSYDWREWLQENGASPASLGGAFMRGIYDLMFAYEGGDTSRPRFAAGVALRGAVRMFFTYRGALFYRMTAGMGDVVFAPLYEVLKRRGVRFQFFHRLENIGLAPEREVPRGKPPWVMTLELDVQAKVLDGKDYEPLICPRGLPSWPSRARYEQLESGERLEREEWDFESGAKTAESHSKVLRVGKDFDLVVLAVGGGAVRSLTPELTARSPVWRTMLANLNTVATQAFQLWMTADMAKLGWRGGPASVSGFVEPFDTWADMTHVLPREQWEKSGLNVKSIAYFCSVLPDERPLDASAESAFAEEQSAAVRKNAVGFLNDHVGWLWPGAVQRGEFRWEVLADKSPAEGEKRFDSQYWRANVEPTDRYVVSLPGTIQH
ncbi:MAG: NAD(P)-binding protein, partial [Byssovorax sp.]